MAPAVLCIGRISGAAAEWQALGSKYTLLEFTGTREVFLANCRNGVYDAVVGCYRSNRSTRFTGPFDAELVAALPATWRYIAHDGAGYDSIDVDACSRRRIAISHTPIVVNNATADVAIFLMLGALRMAHISITSLRAGKWGGETPQGHDPEGKTLAILGMGGIGRTLAQRARAFGMRIIYHNRQPLTPELAQDAEYVSFDELLARADVLSLNLSLNATTRHIIGVTELARMKPGVVIVNTARGALIDEAALAQSLKSGHVSALGLDVYEDEPNVHPGLMGNPRAFLLPHIGTYTVETARAMELLALKNLEAAADEGRMLTLIPQQKGLEWAPPAKAHER
ncbi:D-isomer specific 2-hydroxyacid dehydrogenase [Xylaria nigripes]|nr:D-isomer specific 2-hydroxyacid dehydrogenase [Xylaria nigripes]